jgi:hypothetical protein
MKVKSYNKALRDLKKKILNIPNDNCKEVILSLIDDSMRSEGAQFDGVPNPPTDPKGGGTR